MVSLIIFRLRRVQDLAHEHLADGKRRFSPPDRATARKRAAFLRAVVGRNSRPRHGWGKPSGFVNASSNPSVSLLVTPKQELDPASVRYTRLGESDSNGVQDTSTAVASEQTSESNATLPNPSITSETEAGGSTNRNYPDAELVIKRPIVTTTDTAVVDTKNCDSQVSDLSRNRKVRKVFSQCSFSSSFVSDLISLIDQRFSLSTLATSSRYSISIASVAENEIRIPEFITARVLEQQHQLLEKANVALKEECCSKISDCRHRVIETYTMTDSDPESEKAKQWDAPVAGCRSYLRENCFLWYAARIGAPPQLLLSLINSEINSHGQTFLFFLNTVGFQRRLCYCQVSKYPSAHSTAFECFMYALESQHFDFDRLDNDGRPFLFYLCASPSFEISWLLNMMLRDSQWDYRVWRMAQIRDSAGLFLIDFLALRPDFETTSENVRTFFRPLFKCNHLRTLSCEDEEGRTELHTYVQKDFVHTVTLLGLPSPIEGIASDINGYNNYGRTPIMDFLQRAFELRIDESIICTKVMELIRYGANVNARSRGGSTILHFAAKKALPQLLEALLATDIQVDHCDIEGLSALEYATKIFQRSRNVKTPAAVTARSLRSTATLLNAVTTFGRNRPSGAKYSDTESAGSKPPNDDIKERAMETLQRLLHYDGRKDISSSLDNPYMEHMLDTT
jgi:ankyrin repeat protein